MNFYPFKVCFIRVLRFRVSCNAITRSKSNIIKQRITFCVGFMRSWARLGRRKFLCKEGLPRRKSRCWHFYGRNEDFLKQSEENDRTAMPDNEVTQAGTMRHFTDLRAFIYRSLQIKRIAWGIYQRLSIWSYQIILGEKYTPKKYLTACSQGKASTRRN